MKLIEKIAESVHTSWWNEKEEQGFHSPKNCPNAIDSYEQGSFDKFKKNCSKCHADMYPYNELPENVKQYDRVTVKAVLKSLEEEGFKLPSKKEPKFQVGDEIVYHCQATAGKIWGIGDTRDACGEIYGVALNVSKGDEYEVENNIVRERDLTLLKKKDKLEVGDKFKCKTAIGKTNKINIVLAVAEDEKLNQVKYLAKRITGEWIGYVDVYNAELIDEIIYE